MSRTRRPILKVLLPVAVVGLGILAAALMVLSKDAPETRVVDVPAPAVRVTRVVLQDVGLVVRSQGTVSPRTESKLVPEVSGRIIRVAASFVSGGFFERGEVLLTIDPHDYRQAVAQAHASLASAELLLDRERAEADVARREWKDLGEGEPSRLTLREPQVLDAEARVDAARAAVERAERDLARSEIRAPYAGRVRSKGVDVGQFVSRGTPLAEIYAVDAAEIRLPLPDDELAFLDLPLDYRGETENESGPRVVLRARFAGAVHSWEGRIVRTEGEIDPRSRMIHAVARVEDPYARGDDRDRPPLAAGLFVEAEIEGRTATAVAVLPRPALRANDEVLVVSEQGRLQFRTVDVLRRDRDEVVVRDGLADDEQICLTPLAVVTEGMRVRVVEGAS